MLAFEGILNFTDLLEPLGFMNRESGADRDRANHGYSLAGKLPQSVVSFGKEARRNSTVNTRKNLVPGAGLEPALYH
jgi:hypothetical protein